MSTPPTLLLLFGPFDPCGAAHLPADAVSCAALGAHAACVPTGLLAQDTATTEDLLPTPPELLDEQARCLLEDMPLQAIKVGTLYSPEAVSLVAQIAADYSELPLVVHLQRLPGNLLGEDIEADDVHQAVIELLLPLADLVMADPLLLTQWQSLGLLPGETPEAAAQAMLQAGAQWVLLSAGSAAPGRQHHVLLGSEHRIRHWDSAAPAARLIDADGPLACAITVELARHQEMPDAVDQALCLAEPLAARHFQPGMGSRILDRTRA